MLTKICSKCGDNKPVTEFHKRKGRPLGVVSWCKECAKVRAKEKYHATKHVDKTYKLQKAYGITLDEYNILLKSQGGVCAICGGTESSCDGRMLAVDHCHLTGRVRGILCSNCNRALGLFKDSPDTLRSAIKYLGGE